MILNVFEMFISSHIRTLYHFPWIMQMVCAMLCLAVFRYWLILHKSYRKISYKSHQISKLKCFSSRLAVVLAQYFQAKC